jgi:hypothetical protein
MSGRVTARLHELEITLPKPPNPAANYIPARRSGSLLFLAGQVPYWSRNPGAVLKSFKLRKTYAFR